MSASAVYEGTVRHRRFAERRHEFRYPLALTYIDLDELPSLLGGRLVSRRAGVARFRRDDYLGDPAVPLADAVHDLAGGTGPVRLLANLRWFGHCFNPIAFYYCFDPGEPRPRSVVVEVTNTPWGERRAYVADGLRGSPDKALHVSPFMPMEQRYDIRLSVPGETLSVHVESRSDDFVAFDATLSLRRRPLDSAGLRRIALRYPAAGARTLAFIYTQALRLRAKGVTWHPHPNAR